MDDRAQQTLERELKLDVDESFTLPALGGRPLEPRTFTSTYYDTADRRLSSSNLTLRRRLENGKGAWQLKLPRDEGRLELEAPGGPAGPPAALAKVLAGVLRSARLEPVATLRTRREGVALGDGAASVEVVVDEVSVLDGQRGTASFRELEIEATGADGDLAGVAKVLRKAGAHEGDGRPKLFRVLGLDAAVPAKNAAASEHLRAMLDRQYRELLVRDAAVRAVDEEHDIHQFRVATRRLRAILRAAERVLEPEWARGLRDELGWLADALGMVRDLDVLLAYLRAEASTLDPADRAALEGALELLDEERVAVREALLATLDEDRYRALLDHVDDAVRAPRFLHTDFAVADFAAAEYRRLRRALKALRSDETDEALHRVRIHGKRARYAAELAEAEVGKPAGRFIAEAKRLQDVLGEHQDAAVAEERLRALARRARRAGAAFAAGRVAERQLARRQAAAKALPAVWETLERAGRKAWS